MHLQMIRLEAAKTQPPSTATPSSRPGFPPRIPKPRSNWGPSRVTFARLQNSPWDVPEALFRTLPGLTGALGPGCSRPPSGRIPQRIVTPGVRTSSPPRGTPPRPLPLPPPHPGRQRHAHRGGPGRGRGCPPAAAPPPAGGPRASRGPEPRPPPLPRPPQAPGPAAPPRAPPAEAASAAGRAAGPRPPPRADWLTGAGGGAEWPGRFAGSGLQRRLAHRRERSRGARSPRTPAGGRQPA